MRWWACLSLLVSAAGQEPSSLLFRSEARLVEVPITVLDSRGRPHPGLSRGQFEILENGRPQNIVAFESGAASVAIAILLDTTGSMEAALPAVKSAVNTFIGMTRTGDAVAVFAFRNVLEELQPFTTVKNDARRAVLRTRAGGETALFDGIAETISRISGRTGRKALVVFTDGRDTASALNAAAAVKAAQSAGVPVFAAAAGAASRDRKLTDVLRQIAEATGGAAYTAGRTGDLKDLFEDIRARVESMYLAMYSPPPWDRSGWRSISVRVKAPGRLDIRTRRGYFVE